MTPEWQRALATAAARTRLLFDEGRSVCDGVDGRLRYELRATWLGGMRILDRLERSRFDVIAQTAVPGRAGCAVDRAAARRVASDRRAAMSRDTSFYYSFLVLPPRKRSAIVAVWDFCRAVDDAVDEAPAGTSADVRLSLWRDELAACYSDVPGVAPRTTQGRNLRPCIREFDLPRGPFEDLIDGVEMDLAHVRYETFDALAEYCRRVASAVGLVCVEIFGYRDSAARVVRG